MSQTLGQLAQLYAMEHRYQEALGLNQQALTAIQSFNAAYWRYQWQWQRARLFKALGKPKQAMFFYQAVIKTLAPIRQALTQLYRHHARNEFQEIFKPLFSEFVALLLQQASTLSMKSAKTEKNQMLKQVLSAMDLLKEAELQNYFQDDCIKPKKGINDIGTHTAVIYPIFLPDKVELLVSLPAEEMQRFTVAVTPDKLKQAIQTLRETIACQQTDYEMQRQCRKGLAYQKPANQLYQWLIHPLEAKLSQRRIDTLIFVPDDDLYTIPLAVLQDGDTFLIDKYALAVVPGLTLTEPHPAQTVFQTDSVPVLFNGLTKIQSQTAPPLLYTEAMGKQIKALFPDTNKLQGEHFTKTEISNTLTITPYSIIHIHSHAQFEDMGLNTYISTYDDKLRLNELENLLAPSQLRDKPIELLTLSACETAKGNQQAALGLSGIAFKAGTRSAIGTLWKVDERVSFALFQAFYEILRDKQNISRAKILQAAQKSLRTKYPNFKHPHYWGAFLLIGNWL